MQPIQEKKSSFLFASRDNVQKEIPSNTMTNVSNKNSIYPENYETQARFSVTNQKFEIVIDIIGSKTKLVKPDNRVFSDLKGVLMQPGFLCFFLFSVYFVVFFDRV